MTRSARPGDGRRCGVDGVVLHRPGRTVSALLWRLLAGMAWWPVARCQGTTRGGVAGDARVAAPVACTAVLDVAHEQQRSGGRRARDAEVRWGWK
jgi:hypothetical protein